MKLKNKIKVAGLTGLAAVCLSGCETTGGLNSADLYSVLLGTYAETPASDQYGFNRRIAADLTSNVLSKSADAERAEDVARAGATRVEQNVKVGANLIPLETGKTYEITYRVSNGNILTRGGIFQRWSKVNYGYGTSIEAFFVSNNDGAKYLVSPENILDIKPMGD